MPERAVDPADPNYFNESSQFIEDLIGQEAPTYEEEVDEQWVDETQEGVSIDIEPLYTDAGTDAGKDAPRCQKKGTSKRMQAYAECEDKQLCEAGLEMRQDPICGAEQKGTVYWKRIYDFFHEHRLLPPYSFMSDWGEVSLQKRWGLIQSECNKFAGAHDHVKARPVSGVGVGDGDMILKEAPKWQEVYLATKKSPDDGKKRDCSVINLEASGHTEAATRAVRPWGRTNSKLDAKREASNLSFEETLKKMWSKKDAVKEKMLQQMEEQMKEFLDVQKRKLAIKEANAVATKTAAAATMLAEDTRIMTADLSLMDPPTQAWFEAKRKIIEERDAPTEGHFDS
ncbi:hypothetical protein BRADI_3g24892v3 [Brachypodium distachyon]|uniref:No apical meristem-associated C-terminal domain-containing protein n=2 Tax=Brachypodium distachyon TaxID=15368 RepID=A0A2K2CZ71_BRADI|nr:hypothetical protein BRADI_3g24892v3 [Brachypodium distachyon]